MNMKYESHSLNWNVQITLEQEENENCCGRHKQTLQKQYDDTLNMEVMW
jgi:hypothetical protein